MKQILLLAMAVVLVGCVSYDWHCRKCGASNEMVGFGVGLGHCHNCGLKIQPDQKSNKKDK